MKASNIAPFVDAVAQVGERLFSCVPTRGELSVTMDLVTNYPINILTGLTGDIEGVVLFGLNRESALGIAEVILNKKLRVFDQSVSFALVKFGEMILDRDTLALDKLGVDFELLPPAIVRGVGIGVPTNNQPTLIVPLHFEKLGSICVKLSVVEKQFGQAA
jgi:chemotaxis protein CheX